MPEGSAVNVSANGSWLEDNRPRVVVELKCAIRGEGGKEVTSLSIRQPCTHDLRQVTGEGFERPLDLLTQVIARCSGQPESTIALLTMEDLTACAKALNGLGFTTASAFALLAGHEL